LHKHIEDVRRDLNYSSTDVSIFSETRFSHTDSDDMYSIDEYSLFRNDSTSTGNIRPFGGTAVYSHTDYYPGYPYSLSSDNLEITVLRFMIIPHITIISVYRSPRTPVTQLCSTLSKLLTTLSTKINIFIGDFNINWLSETQRVPLYNLFIRDYNYRQLVSCYTTDNKTCIDHIFTNLSEFQVQINILETYFSDHKAVCALINCF